MTKLQATASRNDNAIVFSLERNALSPSYTILRFLYVGICGGQSIGYSGQNPIQLRRRREEAEAMYSKFDR
ncbi:hypothetical protein L916_15223 [Phytophthora nicotianae]|uniref:Uncharacterized protein n=1 Tax=Phytophthora nicotianae TaxID=4792 RepID=W2IDM5_PHYNI|nr:hypothetical protein L916_15223 [Phytophthora nicotianae]